MRGWLIAGFLLQVFVIYSYLSVLPVLEAEPMLLQVADTSRRDHKAEIKEDIKIETVTDDNATIEQLLAKLKRTGDAVKFQIEEQAAKRQYIPVKSSSKIVKKLSAGQNSFKIASYNLWNVNGMWESRIERIADMFAVSDPDIIAFQEVRTLKKGSSLQLLQPFRMAKDLPIDGTLPMPDGVETMMNVVHKLLPQYQWAVFVPMAGFQDGTQEGVAIVSKHPIVMVDSGELNVVGPYSDRNTRGVLQARVTLPQSNEEEPLFIDIFNTHLTYDDRQQCPMIVKLLDFLEQSKENSSDVHQVVLGDLNTYLTAEWPTDFMQDPFAKFSSNELNPCYQSFTSWIDSHQNKKDNDFFLDIWEEAFPRAPDGSLIGKRNQQDDMAALGHTFPVFKDSALVNCRPDRVLRRTGTGLQLISVATFGDKQWFEATDTSKTRGHFLSDHLGILVEFSIE